MAGILHETLTHQCVVSFRQKFIQLVQEDILAAHDVGGVHGPDDRLLPRRDQGWHVGLKEDVAQVCQLLCLLILSKSLESLQPSSTIHTV